MPNKQQYLVVKKAKTQGSKTRENIFTSNDETTVAAFKVIPMPKIEKSWCPLSAECTKSEKKNNWAQKNVLPLDNHSSPQFYGIQTLWLHSYDCVPLWLSLAYSMFMAGRLYGTMLRKLGQKVCLSKNSFLMAKRMLLFQKNFERKRKG